jgi:hypothetical protein
MAALALSLASTTFAAVLPAVGSGTLVVRLDAGTSVIKDGSDFVSSWDDQTGVGDNYGGTFVQATLASQPQWIANAYNGQPAIRFTSDHLRSTLATDLSADESIDQTYFIVATNPSNNPQNILDTAPNVAGPLRFLLPNRVAEQNNDAGGTTVALTPRPPSGASVLTIRHNGDVGTNTRIWEAFVNGSFFSTNTEAGRRIRWRQPAIGGTNLGTAGFFAGDIAEILVYQGVLTNADRQAVEAYLIEKYVPEPSALGLVAFAGVTMLRRTRRRR